LRLLRRQHLRLDPGSDLVHKVSLEALDVGGVVHQEEVAVEAEVELLPRLFLEALQPSDWRHRGRAGEAIPAASGVRCRDRPASRRVVGA
jgi:hypothetical protein